MRGQHYRKVVGPGSRPAEGPETYVLHVGPVELEAVPYSTLIGLGDRLDVVCEVLEVCFIDRPVMWADPSTLHPRNFRERLSEIEALLRALDSRFELSSRPCDRVLARVIGIWRDLTEVAVERLESRESSEITPAVRSALADYRRSMYACVEALLQLLPEHRECSVEARGKLEQGRLNLIGVLGIEPDEIEHAGWRAEALDEPGFVTWGIP